MKEIIKWNKRTKKENNIFENEYKIEYTDVTKHIEKKRFHIREIKKKKEGIFIQHVKNYHSYNALDFDINIFIYIHTHTCINVYIHEYTYFLTRFWAKYFYSHLILSFILFKNDCTLYIVCFFKGKRDTRIKL